MIVMNEYALLNVFPDGSKLSPDQLRLLAPYCADVSLEATMQRAEEINKSRRESQNFGELPAETYVKVIVRTVTYGPWTDLSDIMTA